MTRRGVNVGQSDRLGDTAINEANATTRHNAVKRCIYNARAAVATATVCLGDKGSTTQSRMEASRRFEMYNKGHVPDIIEIDAIDTLYEVKCWTPIRKFQALGHGSTKKGGKKGGAVSTNEGSHIALGGTAESARHLTLGLQAARHGGPGALRSRHRRRLRGRARRHAGHYADALAKGRQVVLIVVETTGAVHPDAIADRYAVRVARRSARRGVLRPHGLRRVTHGHHILLHAPPAPHLARRSDRRGAPRRHLGEIPENLTSLAAPR